MAILLLQFGGLGLQQLHLARGLDLLHEQRDQSGPDDDRQHDDRHAQFQPESGPEERAEQLVEEHQDAGDHPVERLHDGAAEGLDGSYHNPSDTSIGIRSNITHTSLKRREMSARRRLVAHLFGKFRGTRYRVVPAGRPGWQRSSRRAASQLLLTAPCTEMARSAYAEQLG